MLVKFLVEMTRSNRNSLINNNQALYVNGLLNGKGSRIGMILKGLNDIVLEYLLKFDFKASNN